MCQTLSIPNSRLTGKYRSMDNLSMANFLKLNEVHAKHLLRGKSTDIRGDCTDQSLYSFYIIHVAGI